MVIQYTQYIKNHFLAGKRLSSIRLVPQLAAAPMTPPATARPTNAAPATTMGAILGLGEEENEGSTEMVFMLMRVGLLCCTLIRV